MDSTITPTGIWADYLLPIATHFERHDVALPWYKGHYYIHRPKVIQPMGESKSDFQVLTELAYRLGFGPGYNPRATRDYFKNDDPVDEAYLEAWWHNVQQHQGVTMSWEEFKKRGVYKFKLPQPHVAFRAQVETGLPFQTPSGKIEILSTVLGQITGLDEDAIRLRDPGDPEVDRAVGIAQQPKTAQFPFHMISPHPRWRTHSIFNNIAWLRETYEQEVTINASDARRLGIKTGDTVEVWNDRGKAASCRPTSPSAACPASPCCTRARGWISTRTASTGPAIPTS